MKSGFQRLLRKRALFPQREGFSFTLLKVQQPFGEMLKGLFPADDERTLSQDSVSTQSVSAR